MTAQSATALRVRFPPQPTAAPAATELRRYAGEWEVREGGLLLNYASSISEASLVAIAIFALTSVAKTVSSIVRQRRLNAALAILIGEEIRENFKHLQIAYALFEDIEKEIDENEFEYGLYRSGSGLDHAWVKTSSGSHQAPLNELTSSTYNRLASEMIEINMKTFKAVHRCYQALDRYNKLRASIGAALARDAAPIEVSFARGQITMLLGERKSLERQLQHVHFLLAGQQIRMEAGQVESVQA